MPGYSKTCAKTVNYVFINLHTYVTLIFSRLTLNIMLGTSKRWSVIIFVSLLKLLQYELGATLRSDRKIRSILRRGFHRHALRTELGLLFQCQASAYRLSSILVHFRGNASQTSPLAYSGIIRSSERHVDNMV